ncbi:hypothetical protein [Caulobacter soli]|uniref:hypothetical protein n=1 Tax=Caulobacter soli TaxID=2708539 RepID=UPI0013EA7D77|nr:hypothetical protein [Caulobacter soli]
MIADDFRQLALGIEGARTAVRLGAVEFLIGQTVFATVGAPDPAFAVLRLLPGHQAKAILAVPTVFSPQAGGAGRRGVTCVRLTTATPDIVRPYLVLAAAKARNRRSTFTQIRQD